MTLLLQLLLSLQQSLAAATVAVFAFAILLLLQVLLFLLSLLPLSLLLSLLLLRSDMHNKMAAPALEPQQNYEASLHRATSAPAPQVGRQHAPAGLRFVTGDCGIPEIADLDAAQRSSIMTNPASTNVRMY